MVSRVSRVSQKTLLKFLSDISNEKSRASLVSARFKKQQLKNNIYSNNNLKGGGGGDTTSKLDTTKLANVHTQVDQMRSP